MVGLYIFDWFMVLWFVLWSNIVFGVDFFDVWVN